VISLQVSLRGLGFTCKHAGSALPEGEIAAGVGPTVGVGPIGSIVAAVRGSRVKDPYLSAVGCRSLCCPSKMRWVFAASQNGLGGLAGLSGQRGPRRGAKLKNNIFTLHIVM
jgi:hypothetical protein